MIGWRTIDLGAREGEKEEGVVFPSRTMKTGKTYECLLMKWPSGWYDRRHRASVFGFLTKPWITHPEPTQKMAQFIRGCRKGLIQHPRNPC